MSPDDTAVDTAESDAPEPPEPDELREGLVAQLTDALGDSVIDSHIRPGDDVWVRVERDAWLDAGHVVRDSLECKYFDFLSVIDWSPSPFGLQEDSELDVALDPEPSPEPEPIATGHSGGETRFQVLARVMNIVEHFGLTLKVDIPDDDPTCPSWSRVYAGADWHEREALEMFGIAFVGHPDARPLYLPAGFEGFPLRKDFPLLARRVKPWPGIVDVEAMPELDDEATADEEST